MCSIILFSNYKFNMVRSKKDPPKFLTKPLNSKKAELVRKEFPRWVPNGKAAFGDKLSGDFECILHFIKHLSRKDKDFKGLVLS